ncbi:hypothetical protein [Thermus islandicus]|uniref:hypothetical protein n=1 Tax=Thermus islandicus TaxID=540988 RepID=UPI00041AB44E|nr:hypothetical protein [Thermus islandicus]
MWAGVQTRRASRIQGDPPGRRAGERLDELGEGPDPLAVWSIPERLGEVGERLRTLLPLDWRILGAVDGELFRMPAEFLLDEELRVVRAHGADRLPLPEVLAWARANPG